MDAVVLGPILADCPRCGGWARKLDAAARRWTCRGCRWNGFVSR